MYKFTKIFALALLVSVSAVQASDKVVGDVVDKVVVATPGFLSRGIAFGGSLLTSAKDRISAIPSLPRRILSGTAGISESVASFVATKSASVKNYLAKDASVYTVAGLSLVVATAGSYLAYKGYQVAKPAAVKAWAKAKELASAAQVRVHSMTKPAADIEAPKA